jgi:hypothetical protein
MLQGGRDSPSPRSNRSPSLTESRLYASRMSALFCFRDLLKRNSSFLMDSSVPALFSFRRCRNFLMIAIPLLKVSNKVFTEELNSPMAEQIWRLLIEMNFQEAKGKGGQFMLAL